MMNKLTGLIHDEQIFSKNHLINTSLKYGFTRNYVIERHLWCYELLAHLQNFTSKTCVLKGGACTQIYLPLANQRCTADIDCLTSLSSKDLEEILTNIKENFNSNDINFSFKEYVPSSGKNLPMATFMIDLPFYYNPKKHKNNFLLKMDFVFMDVSSLSLETPTSLKTFGMDLNYAPICICPISLISDKLLTFAINSIGLETFKVDSFYKNIYDLYYLIYSREDFDTLCKVSDKIKESVSMELALKKLPTININKLLNDILRTLLYFSIVDLNYEHSTPPRKLYDFERLYLQKDIKEALNKDTWSIMSMHLYLWTKALKRYINSKNKDHFENINSVKSEYEYFLTLSSKNKSKYIKTLKSLINSKNKKIKLRTIDDPLRLIYMNYLF
ncbi:hypothetical protein ACER0A_000965 [Haloimpatiens sp. FM7315]|uniref:hypothetical protein n=1 Tax=Haloimpatiens sp. FM7315 TaxID=3298609 RepID=UPI00370A3915